MIDTLIFLLVALPLLAGTACLIIRAPAARLVLVCACCTATAAASLAAWFHVPWRAGEISLAGFGLDSLVTMADFLLVGLIAAIGLTRRSALVVILSMAQAALLVWQDFMAPGALRGPAFRLDHLSAVMAVVVSLAGGAICVYALPYMKDHERLHPTNGPSRQPGFFLVLVGFLGAMNGLVLTGDLLHFYFYFELTTLCSYLLIRHDRTPKAEHNAMLALWMNSLGGLALILGLVWAANVTGSLDMDALVPVDAAQGRVLAPALALMALAAMVKAAQFPFQGWLLGAMVAPTPTSALLHSSTMVKAGIYLLLRLSPALAGTGAGWAVALAGSFSFAAGAALALGQSNAKKILAYSTVSNLGLMAACAGLGTPEALAAATLLLVFHAAAKAMLFLAVGTVEQGIGSRDAEDMRGLAGSMPLAAAVLVLGAMFMILPPFGMLAGKWLALKTAASTGPAALILIAVGSAMTVAYWTRWAGSLFAASEPPRADPGTMGPLKAGPLAFLASATLTMTLASPWMFPALAVRLGGGSDSWSAWPAVVLCLAAGLGLWAALKSRRTDSGRPRASAYMSGINGTKPGTFTGPMDAETRCRPAGDYLPALFGEARLTPILNAAALALLALLAGGALP